MRETEFLIVGAGIVGMSLARGLLAKGADKITIIDKEPRVGEHASGRNSGVLHAGIYYPPETLKAKLCLKGNLLMQTYCEEMGLPLNKCGKVIVARNDAEIDGVRKLYERAKQNGAKVALIDERELAEIEPNAKTVTTALYSHYTASVDNLAVLNALSNELLQSGKVEFVFHSAFETVDGHKTARTSAGNILFKYFINAAGAYADKVAHQFSVGKEYYFIPFKGIYYKLTPDQTGQVNGNIYPVPNLKNPFLGVHFSRNIRGDIYVGPTAIPAFGRENYGLLRGIDKEAPRIVLNEIKLLMFNAQFRSVAFSEPKKYLSSCFFNDAKCLVKHLKPEWLSRATKVGIRPQLINVATQKMEMDFLVKKTDNAIHILNAISPAFTSSFAFSDYVLENYLTD